MTDWLDSAGTTGRGSAMSEPFDHLLEKYARLVVRVGVNVQPGQEVVVNCLPEQADAARALAEEAYRVGASRVSIDYGDPHLQRAAVRHAPDDQLGSSRPDELEKVRAWRETRPALISLTGNPFPTLMDGLDPATTREVGAHEPDPGNRCRSSRPTRWPGRWWGRRRPVGQPAWGSPTWRALWDAVAIAMRLDEADPERAWRHHIAKLRRTSGRPQPARLRSRALPRSWHRRHDRPRRRVAMGRRLRGEPGRRGVRAQHAHRGGLLLPRLAPRRGNRPDDRALLPHHDGRHRGGPRARGAGRHDHRGERLSR